MILLFTDFGGRDIYSGQIRTVLAARAPGVQVIDLLQDAPDYNALSGAYLLAALAVSIPAGAVTMAVVDAGVGSMRRAIVLEADGRWFVGPDNGLLSVVAARAQRVRLWEIAWRPPQLSKSFHGRDLFAPLAAMIATNTLAPDALAQIAQLDVSFGADELAQIIYVDHYGNAMTGVRAEAVPRTATLTIGSAQLRYARVFSEVSPGCPFWYENSIGLVEVAVNLGSAAERLRLSLGDKVQWSS